MTKWDRRPGSFLYSVQLLTIANYSSFTGMEAVWPGFWPSSSMSSMWQTETGPVRWGDTTQEPSQATCLSTGSVHSTCAPWLFWEIGSEQCHAHPCTEPLAGRQDPIPSVVTALDLQFSGIPPEELMNNRLFLGRCNSYTHTHTLFIPEVGCTTDQSNTTIVW